MGGAVGLRSSGVSPARNPSLRTNYEFTTRRSTEEKRGRPEAPGLAEEPGTSGSKGFASSSTSIPTPCRLSARRAVGRSSPANAGKEVRGGAPAASDGAVHRPVVSPGVRRFSGKE